MERCVQTTKLLQIETETLFVTVLKELSFGEFEGFTAEECEDTFPESWKNWCESGTVPSGGESTKSFTNRIKMFLTECQNLEVDTVAFVTHGGVIRLILSLLLWGDTENQWRTQIDPGSIAKISFNDGFAFLTSLTSPQC